jgi:hypothetical protein
LREELYADDEDVEPGTISPFCDPGMDVEGTFGWDLGPETG